VKQITNLMLGFKSFWSAEKLIAGIESMHMVQKGQLYCTTGGPMPARWWVVFPKRYRHDALLAPRPTSLTIQVAST
jgi:hypothetical protein